MTMQLKVPDMACSACVNNITQAVQQLDAAAQVNADLDRKTVNVDTQESEQAVKQAISAAGYSVD
jgi:copper chaperone